MSDELSSLMTAQLSERDDLLTVFDELFDSAGCDIVLGPAGHYVDDASVSIAQLRMAGLARNETVLGYRIAATRAIVVNPPRAAEVASATDDEVLVLTRATARASRAADQLQCPSTDPSPARTPGFATTS